MKRDFYSQQFVRSPLNGQTVVVPSKALEVLLSWAETTPGVQGYEQLSPVLTYQRGASTLETRVPLTLTMQDGSRQYWDIQMGAETVEHTVRKHFAQSTGGGYRCFGKEDLTRPSIEKRNRSHLRSLMFQGCDFESSAAERRLLEVLMPDGNTVRQLSAAMGYSTTQVLVISARLWRKELVQLPLADEPLSEDWTIRRRTTWI